MKVKQHWLSWPLIRRLRCWQFRRLEPLDGGAQRGTPIVRYYQAQFLDRYRSDIHGTCLEIGETTTIREYGGDAIVRADALDLSAHSPDVRVVADLSRADHVEADQYDCFVNQFTMTVVFDVEAALYHAIRILKPGGVLLVNFGCVDYFLHQGLDMGTGAPLYMHHWFTPLQVEDTLRRLGLGADDYKMNVYGNLATRIAFQMNIPSEELSARERDTIDPGHPLLICVRVEKPLDWHVSRPTYRQPAYLPGSTPARLSERTGHYGDAYQ
jgi:SAM-dependent methyltransferase